MSVTFINALNVPPSREAEFLDKWDRGAGYMRGRDGFVSTSLHRALPVRPWRKPELPLPVLHGGGLGERGAPAAGHGHRVVARLRRRLRLRLHRRGLRGEPAHLRTAAVRGRVPVANMPATRVAGNAAGVDRRH